MKKERQNLKERLRNREVKKANVFLFFAVTIGFRLISRMRNVHYTYLFDRKKYLKQQVILLSAHASRDEYIYTLAGFNKRDMHCVVGYQNFFSKPLYPLLLRSGAIAKYLYETDFNAVKQMLRVISKGESLVLFPEGVQSTAGGTHPINPATMNFIKKCRLPVILCTSTGSYMTRPRYSSTIRKGRIDVTYRLLFEKEDYRNFSAEELYARLLEAFRYNDFQYNRQAMIPFHGKCANAEGLEHILYKCPHCKEEFSLNVQEDTLTCRHCDTKVHMDEYYALHWSREAYFEDIDQWYQWQRREVAREVVTKDFSLLSGVKIYDINLVKLQNKLLPVGEGSLSITNHWMVYEGDYKGSRQKLEFDIRKMPSLSFTPKDNSVDLYYNGDYYCFAPTTCGLQVVKWMLVIEEIHNLYDPAWAKASKEVYDT